MDIKKASFSILSIIGLFAPTSVYAQEIQSIDADMPIILQHSQDFQNVRNSVITKINNDNADAALYHYSHCSHYSHSSHSSHRSHYSSRY